MPKSIDLNNYHFFSPISAVIPPNSELKVDTGIKVIFPNTESLIFKRDNHLILDHKIEPNKNHINNEFDAILTLVNNLDREVVVNKGDFLCQAMFEKV